MNQTSRFSWRNKHLCSTPNQEFECGEMSIIFIPQMNRRAGVVRTLSVKFGQRFMKYWTNSNLTKSRNVFVVIYASHPYPGVSLSVGHGKADL